MFWIFFVDTSICFSGILLESRFFIQWLKYEKTGPN